MRRHRFVTVLIASIVTFTPMLSTAWADGVAAVKKEFTLTDYMKVYDFPEQQVSYPVDLPAGTKPESLALLSVTGNSTRMVPFQLSKDAKGGTTLFFRTDLPMGVTRSFRLQARTGADLAGVSAQAPTLVAAAEAKEAVLGNGLLLVKVPTGHQDFAAGTPFSQAPAPVLGLARKGQPQPWMATGSFSAPATVLVESMEGGMAESGPLFVIYQVAYRLQGGKSYTVTLELRANEPYVRVAEAVHGFTPDDQAFLRLNYGKGMLDPDRCLVASNGGYVPSPRQTPYSGAYGEHASTDDSSIPWGAMTGWFETDSRRPHSEVPRLSYSLGLYAPNAIAVMHATAFYREKGTEALLLSLNRLTEWKTYERAIWSSFWSFENLRFYCQNQDGQKYMAAGLAGERRFWVVGLVPRSEIKIPLPTGIQGIAKEPYAEPERLTGKEKLEEQNPPWRKAVMEAGAGPEAKLFNQLNDWSLDAYKDRAVDWPEKLSGAPFDAPGFFLKPRHEKTVFGPMSYDAYNAQFKLSLIESMAKRSFDFGVGGSVELRGTAARFGVYAMSRAGWTQQQRERIRQILIFLADSCDGDANEPHHSMLAGHPNFVMDVKAAIPAACATFPNHPRAKAWRDSFMSYYNEWLDKYVRKAVPELNTKAGRWTENIACYLGQSLVGLEDSQKCLKAYDGTSLGQDPQLFTLLRWVRDSFMSPHEGVRMIPPQGAHSAAFSPGGRDWLVLFKLCSELAGDNPQLAAEMRWMETNGKEGQKPDVRSALYTDYGPIFHYDFGGSHESYAHMQNINGMRYRWGFAGIVYYGAKDKAWSYNADETNGDFFDWHQVSAFNVGGKGMQGCPTDQLLYDFDFAQFYRQPAKDGEAYLARGLMLLRDDYLVLSDEVKDATVAGTFNWVTFFTPPQIYQLKPGAAMQEKETHDAAHSGRHSFDPVIPIPAPAKCFLIPAKAIF